MPRGAKASARQTGGRFAARGLPCWPYFFTALSASERGFCALSCFFPSCSQDPPAREKSKLRNRSRPRRTPRLQRPSAWRSLKRWLRNNPMPRNSRMSWESCTTRKATIGRPWRAFGRRSRGTQMTAKSPSCWAYRITLQDGQRTPSPRSRKSKPQLERGRRIHPWHLLHADQGLLERA